MHSLLHKEQRNFLGRSVDAISEHTAVAKLKLTSLSPVHVGKNTFLSCRTHFSMQFFLRLRLEFYCAFTFSKQGFKAVKNSAAPCVRFSIMIRKFQIALLLRSPENASISVSVIAVIKVFFH